MGTILVVENDPIFGAVVEDRLHVAGHTVEVLSDTERVVASVVEAPRDLLIYAMDEAAGDGLGLIRDLRQRTETRALPILVLAASHESSDRVAALRAGADEYLSKPCDLEELLLRVERLAGARTAGEPVLRGDLASHPPWELIQYLRQAAKSGDLVVRGHSANGRVRVRKGHITGAQCGQLPAPEALLALLGEKEGRFRFQSAAEVPEDAGTQQVSSVHEVLLQAAWLEDELDKRRDHLPPTGAPLIATGKPLPALGEDHPLAGLPVAEVHAMVSRKGGVRVHDLIGRLPWAPQKVRLSVSWLVEEGVLAPPSAVEDEVFPTTHELTSSILLDIAVGEFLKAAREAGFSTKALPFLVLAQPGVWSVLLDLIEKVPGFQASEDLKGFADQLRLRRGGSVAFQSEHGKLSLHVQVLKSEVRAQIDGVISACAGVLVWLDEGGEEELLRGVVERLEKTRGVAGGMLVATGPEALRLALELTEGSERWRVSSHAPQSLLGVLRLLQPARNR